MQPDPPSAQVIETFGLSGRTEPSTSPDVWRVGSVALKRVNHLESAEWVCELLANADDVHGFRLPLPVAAQDGRWTVDGWWASRWLPGEADGSRWRSILEAGDLLHLWLSDMARPKWLDRIDDPWRQADRAAWGEQLIGCRTEFTPLMDDVVSMRRPVSQKNQLIHGDLTGNVLFSAGLQPGIIDLSMYWRPPGFAAAIVAVDCYEWEGVGREVLEEVALRPEGEQMLFRAALFRIVRAAIVEGGVSDSQLQTHRRTVSTIRSMMS